MVDTILRIDAVFQATGLKRTKLYDLVSKGEFPKPVPITGKAVGWLASEVRAWQDRRIAKRDGGAE